ncbi:MAG TPA: hypothetical protein VKR24_11880 [Candidatus Limnocylindrales bacterium]|nr:hypothetical protein [Candidatus Limnocylindrales bacterium]
MAMPSAITGWIRLGTVDAQLAALASTMIEHGLPLVVAARSDASAAGWAGPKVRISLGEILLTCALPPATGTHSPAPLTVDAGTLEAVLARMPALSLEAADETGARLALVMVLGVDEHANAWRVQAAHLLRPPLRDGHGHLQRQGPAVLATWDPNLKRFEHFWWAVLPELAGLIDRRAGDLDAEIGARSDLLAGLVAHRVDDPGTVRLAIEAARGADSVTAKHH